VAWRKLGVLILRPTPSGNRWQKVNFGVTFPPCPSSSARRHGAKFNYTSRPYKTQVTGRRCIVLSLGQGLKQGGLVACSLQPCLQGWEPGISATSRGAPAPCKCTFVSPVTATPASDSDAADFFLALVARLCRSWLWERQYGVIAETGALPGSRHRAPAALDPQYQKLWRGMKSQ
jgi:hypothetical protein